MTEETTGIIIAYTYVGVLYAVGIYYYMKTKIMQRRA